MAESDEPPITKRSAKRSSLIATSQAQAINRRQDVTLPDQQLREELASGRSAWDFTTRQDLGRAPSTSASFDRSSLQRERDELLIALVDAYGRASHEPFEYRRAGDDRGLLYHSGFPGSSIEPNWEHIAALASSGFLAITDSGHRTQLVRLTDTGLEEILC